MPDLTVTPEFTVTPDIDMYGQPRAYVRHGERWLYGPPEMITWDAKEVAVWFAELWAAYRQERAQ